jgi:site-specific recombinase XerD
VLGLISTLKDEGKAPTTINNYLSAIKGGSKAAWMAGVISADVYGFIKEVKRVKGSRTTKGRALSPDEMSVLANTCDGSMSSLRDSALLLLTYSAGMRRQEVAKLQLSDIDLKENSVTILGKGNRQAVNYVNDKAISTLKKWIKVRGSFSGFLFTRIRKGDKITPNGITGQAVADIVCKRYQDAGLERLSAHDLRRSFATNLLDAGVDVFVVSDLMRHSSVETTKTYDLRGEGSRKQAARDLL